VFLYLRFGYMRHMHSLSEPLRRDGQFWLPGSPDRSCFGQLSFDPTSGIDLKLFGSLKQIPESFNNPDVRDGLLHGLLENGAPISLFGSFRKSHQISFGGGFPREIYRVNLAAIGIHAASPDERLTLRSPALLRKPSIGILKNHPPS